MMRDLRFWRRWKFFIISCCLFTGISSETQGQGAFTPDDYGVYFYAETGLHLGALVDVGYETWKSKVYREDQLWQVQQSWTQRPSLLYYRLPQYTNNFAILYSTNYQVRITHYKTDRYVFLEPTLKIGYSRYSYIGKIYKSTPDGFEEKSFGGGNSMLVGAGLNLGGYFRIRNASWVVGADYLLERSEDALNISHINLLAGLRIKIDTDEK